MYNSLTPMYKFHSSMIKHFTGPPRPILTRLRSFAFGIISAQSLATDTGVVSKQKPQRRVGGPR